MNIEFIILTYNRSNVLSKCLETVFENTAIKPQQVWILDDGSSIDMKRGLLEFCNNLTIHNGIPANLVIHGKNKGIGYAFENCYSIIRNSVDVDLFCIIESDYIFRKGWLEDIVAVFEAAPYTMSIAGVDHPDMIDRSKTHGTFVNLMKEQFGHDLKSREFLYKEFILDTARGSIKVRPVSNSCGSQFLHWKRLKNSFYTDPETLNSEINFWKWMERSFNKQIGGDRRYASDAHMSGTVSMFAEENMIDNNIDITKNFGMLSISDFSVSQHLCGSGINGGHYPEGSTFVVSPTFNEIDLTVDPRNKTN